MLVSGGLLLTRSALFPARTQLGLPDDAVRRAWAAFAYGSGALTNSSPLGSSR
jgi:hypothetical protein